MWQLLALVALVGSGRAAAEEEAASAPLLAEGNFKEEVGAGPAFVMFFAPWCGHCKRLAPTWEELAVKYNKAEDREVLVAKVDCTVTPALCSAQDVTGYPTLKFFKSGFEKDDGVKYRGNRDLAALEKFIKEKLGHEAEPEEEKAAEPAEAEVKDGLHILTAKSFAAAIEKGDTFVKFYAPWCGHCIKLAPTWDELAKAYEKDEQVKIAKIDCTQHQSICQEQEVRGYPTLAYFKAGRKDQTYKGARALSELKDFVNAIKGVAAAGAEDGKVPEQPAPSPVLKLGQDNFEAENKEGIVFVKFYAPWCGHCKRMAPTWEQLAEAYKGTEGVKIAHVDCTADGNVNRNLCDGQGVNGFPTVIIYKNGEKVEEYAGKRELDALKAFVEKHRTPIVEEKEEEKKDEKDEL